MLNIKNSHFDQVENIITEKFVEECYSKSEVMSFRKRLLATIFFVGSLQAIYWLGYFLVKESKFFDSNNPFQYLIVPWWIIQIFSAYFSFNMLITAGRYRKRKNILLAYKSNVWLMQLVTIFYVLTLIDLQLLVSNPFLRAVNTLSFFICVPYSLFKAIKETKQMLKNNQDIDKLSKFVVKHQKKIQSFFSMLLILSIMTGMFTNAAPDQKISNRILIALLPILPFLLSIFTIYISPWLTKNLVRMKVLNKFSEDFREKFNVEKKVWYGSNYKK